MCSHLNMLDLSEIKEQVSSASIESKMKYKEVVQ